MVILGFFERVMDQVQMDFTRVGLVPHPYQVTDLITACGQCEIFIYLYLYTVDMLKMVKYLKQNFNE